MYIRLSLNISFDAAKDVLNVRKHGVSLAIAAELEWESAVYWADVRRDYGEARTVAVAFIGLRLHYVVFVDRPGERRVISLRKANQREVRRYAQT